MKMLIVNNHLETGGIKQSLMNLIDNIEHSNIEISVQLLKYDCDSYDTLKEIKGVKICEPINLFNTYFTPLSKQKGMKNKIIKLILKIMNSIAGPKKTIDLINKLSPKNDEEYDIAIAYSNDIWKEHVGGFYGGCSIYVEKKVSAERKIAWIHNEPDKLGLTKEICRETYKVFDEIINVSYACKKKFDEIIPEYKFKSKVVYNMFNIDKINKQSEKINPYKTQDNFFHIVTVARIDNQQKRIDRIIECSRQLIDKGYQNFKWHIVGNGPDIEELREMSRKLEVQDKIIFEGNQKNPYPFMKYADLFVLASDYEAYGMVISESIITGTPVISMNFPAANEVIENDKNGMVVKFDENNNTFNETIESFLSNPYQLKEMKSYIKLNPFSNDRAIKQFNQIVQTNNKYEEKI